MSENKTKAPEGDANTSAPQEPTVAELQKQLAAKDNQLAAKDKQIESLTTINKTIQEKLEDAEVDKKSAGIHTVTVDKVKYKVVGKQFKNKGKVVLAEDLVKDVELCRTLIEKNSGILVKKEK